MGGDNRTDHFVELVAEALQHHVKAYDLPDVCAHFGLDSGDTTEAFQSKRRFVRVRIQNLGSDQIVSLARKVLAEYPSFPLDEAIAIFDEVGIRKSSELTRRNIGRALNGEDLSPRRSLLELLQKIWPIDLMPGGFEFNLAAAINQHVLRNPDWSNDELLQELGAYKCSQARFFRFLESLAHPLTRDEGDQQRLVELLNPILGRDGFVLSIASSVSGYPVYKVTEVTHGVRGSIKNLIFAANGPKPELVLSDAINNDIEIVANAEFCLVYDLPISPAGLSWAEMVEWWKGMRITPGEGDNSGKGLYDRLKLSLSEGPERQFFHHYFKMFLPLLKERLPALVPQVYLHYDPYTLKTLGGSKRLARQRMDFLLLLSSTERIVVEIDGKQHYSTNDMASPGLYAEMVSADRSLRLAGYEVYRFGGAEFSKDSGEAAAANFFKALFQKHGIV